jgi:hypothetical protein
VATPHVRSFTGSLFNDIVAVTRQGNGRAEFDLGPGNDPHNVVADLGGVDVLRVAALAGADEILVEDLTGTGLDRIEFERGEGQGRRAGRPDDARRIVRRGPVTLTAKGTLVAIEGLAAFVQVSHPDPGKDQLILLWTLGRRHFNDDLERSRAFSGGCGKNGARRSRPQRPMSTSVLRARFGGARKRRKGLLGPPKRGIGALLEGGRWRLPSTS